MVRVKDPKASLDFYCNVLGFKLLMYKELPQWKFNVYFVAPVDASTIPEEEEKRWAMCMNTPGCLELTWNYGSETEEGLVYNTMQMPQAHQMAKRSRVDSDISESLFPMFTVRVIDLRKWVSNSTRVQMLVE